METQTFIITPVTVPLQVDADGVVRVGGTRVTLDTIVMGFLEGATAEELAQQYPSLNLADIYSTIGFYLHRRPEVDAYIEKRRQFARQVKEQNESRFDPIGVREHLHNQQGQ
jgi:uncharacterized protein (DUF433 family)